jgi:hypothetical protein
MASRTRQSALSENQLLLQLGPMGGVDSSTDPFELDEESRPINLHYPSMSNFTPDRVYKSFTTTRGRTNFLGSNLPLTKVLAITRYFSRLSTPTWYLAAGYDNANNFKVFKFQPAGVPVQIYSVAGTANHSLATANFVLYRGHLYLSWVDDPSNAGVGQALKFDGALNVTKWQILGPTGAGITPLVFHVAGNLNGLYYYRYSYSNAVQESSPCQPAPTGGLQIANEQAQITLVASADPQVTTINVYRQGGSLSSWILVGTTANVNGNFVDNMADNAVNGQTLVTHRDPPPLMGPMDVWKERVWGFFSQVGDEGGSVETLVNPSVLWCSNQYEPWGWNNVDQVFPVNLNPGAQFNASGLTAFVGDYGIGVAAVSGMLVLFKSKGTYALIGDSLSDFVIQPLFELGCASGQSITKGGGLVFWCTPSQGIFSFDGSNAPNEISKGIQTFLDSLTLADLRATVGFFARRTFFLSFPNQGVTYGYYLPTQQWYPVGFATDAVYTDVENQNEVTAAGPNSGVVGGWFTAETDLGSSIVSTLTSKIEDSGNPEFAKDYNFLLVEAPVQTGTLSITITPDPGSAGGPAPTTLNVDLSLGPRQLRSLDSTMVGTSVQLSLSMTSSAKTTISKVRLYGTIKREFIGVGPG